MIVRDLVTFSSRLIGRLGSGETLRADDAADALVMLSALLDRWQTERLTIYSESRTENPLIPQQQRYTLGPSGDWNQARPLFVDRAARLSSSGLEIPIELITRTRWQRLSLKSMASTLPEGIYINETFPQAQVDVWPIPTDPSVKIVLYVPAAALTSVTSLDTALSLAPGWTSALQSALAIDLGALWAIEPPSALVKLAQDAKAAIKRTNQLSDQVELDAFLTRRTGPVSRADFESGNF